MSVKSTLSSAALLLLGTLALTACESGSPVTSGGPAPSVRASVSAAPVAPVSVPSAQAPAHATAPSGGTRSASATAAADGTATSDGYAYQHPCTGRQLSVHVVRRDSAPSQRVIEVRNTGTHACGLSYYPLVHLGSSQSADHSQDVKPLVPGGLGGAPAYPVYAGQTAYAVIDLDPSGTTTGTTPGLDQLSVLADGDHMPAAESRDFPVGNGAPVLKPKLGLYRNTVADAVTSMTAADTQS